MTPTWVFASRPANARAEAAEDRHSRPELRWFWSITVYINPNLGITTKGRAPTMNEAKEHFLRNWQKCRTVSSCPAPLYSVRVSECRPKSPVVRP